MRIKKQRLFVILFVLAILYLLHKIFMHASVNELELPEELPIAKSGRDLSQLVIFINQFEEFDNDLADTCHSALVACQHMCKVFVATDKSFYPPVKLPPNAALLNLKSGIFDHATNVGELISASTFILLLPDAARISSTNQLKEYIHLLEAGDSEVLALGVGGTLLNCHRHLLDLKSWTLVITPGPESEACDGVGGRAAFLLRTSHFVSLTYPFSRPTSLSLGIQATARNWKIHIGKGVIMGEGRHLYGSDELQWKFQNLENERIRNVYELFGIKKVVSSSGAVEWYGCSRKTPRCFPSVFNETPSYLFKGRWTPPCCLEALRITARHVFQTLRACHVRWWLEGGSLLGAVRNGDIIPWDYDVDLGIYAQDIDRCPQLKSSRWQTLEDSEGFVWQKASQGNFYRVQYSTANHLHVDIFPFQVRHGQMVRNGAWKTDHKQDVDFPEHFLHPLSTISFIGVVGAAPNNVRDFLEFKFGLGVIENPQYPNTQSLNYYNASAPPLNR